MSRKNRPGVILCDMVREIAANLEQITGAAIETAFDDSIVREPVALDGEQAVNTALVLNELLFNALKHGVPRDGRITVGVRLSREAETATVRIFSAGATLPAAFDFQMGSGLGTGLSLVRLLLQPDALKLSLASTPAGVEAILQVRSLARRQPPGPLQPR